MKKDNFVSIGKVVRSQGRRGELRVNLFLELPGKLFFSGVFFRPKGKPAEFQVESFRSFRDFFVVKLEGINSIAQTEEFMGQEIFLLEQDLRPLEKGKFYVCHIIGCAVVSKEGEDIGIVKDLVFIKKNDLLVVESGDREILIPFSNAICVEINLEKKEIVIDPPEGLLELDEI